MSKIWFVTGASSGIGAGITRAVLQAGDRVVATARNLDKARKALAGVTGDNLALVQMDVTKEAQVKAAVAEAVKRFGRIDVAVNNAGYSLLGNFEETMLPEIEASTASSTSCAQRCRSCASSAMATSSTSAPRRA
jgi:NAD(P)-dependent dehydrogenase (short-subunit alcohol dehydrogenase family)